MKVVNLTGFTVFVDVHQFTQRLKLLHFNDVGRQIVESCKESSRTKMFGKG
jgi:hypothetical protein